MKEIKEISPDRILVIYLVLFGEVFMAQGVFEPLKRRFPSARISFCSFSPYHHSIINHPFLDEILVYPREKGVFTKLKFLWSIYKHNFDLVLDLQSFRLTKVITFCSRAKYRIGSDRKTLNPNPLSYNPQKTLGTKIIDCIFYHIYNVKIQWDWDISRAVLYLRWLEPLGIKAERGKVFFHITTESQEYIDNWLSELNLKDKGFVLIMPGARDKDKRWLAENYAKLGDAIQERYSLPIILSGAKDEMGDIRIVYNLMQHKPVIAFETTLNQAVALVNRALILICNDGAMNHFSCATETQTIAIWGKKYCIAHSCHTYFPEHHHCLYNPDFCSGDVPIATTPPVQAGGGRGGVEDADHSFGVSPDDVLKKVDEILNTLEHFPFRSIPLQAKEVDTRGLGYALCATHSPSTPPRIPKLSPLSEIDGAVESQLIIKRNAQMTKHEIPSGVW